MKTSHEAPLDAYGCRILLNTHAPSSPAPEQNVNTRCNTAIKTLSVPVASNFGFQIVISGLNPIAWLQAARPTMFSRLSSHPYVLMPSGLHQLYMSLLSCPWFTLMEILGTPYRTQTLVPNTAPLEAQPRSPSALIILCFSWLRWYVKDP
jgi:hypothetical protein